MGRREGGRREAEHGDGGQGPDDDATHGGTLDAGRALLDRHPDLTAIVCTSDVLALGVLKAAAERGLRVPEDLSVAGYDGIDEAHEVGLTTIQQPLVEKGQVAGRLLLSATADRPRRREVLPTQLRIRRTTGPAPR